MLFSLLEILWKHWFIGYHENDVTYDFGLRSMYFNVTILYFLCTSYVYLIQQWYVFFPFIFEQVKQLDRMRASLVLTSSGYVPTGYN